MFILRNELSNENFYLSKDHKYNYKVSFSKISLRTLKKEKSPKSKDSVLVYRLWRISLVLMPAQLSYSDSFCLSSG